MRAKSSFRSLSPDNDLTGDFAPEYQHSFYLPDRSLPVAKPEVSKD